MSTQQQTVIELHFSSILFSSLSFTFIISYSILRFLFSSFCCIPSHPFLVPSKDSRSQYNQYPENYVLLFYVGSFYISYFLLAYIETVFIVRDSYLFSGHVPTKRLLIRLVSVWYLLYYIHIFSVISDLPYYIITVRNVKSVYLGYDAV